MTLSPTIQRLGNHATVEWTLSGGEDGEAVQMANFRLRSIVISGVFGGAVTVTAANDEAGTQSASLKDRSGSAISATGSGYFDTPGDVNWITPHAAAGVTGPVLVAAYYVPEV